MNPLGSKPVLAAACVAAALSLSVPAWAQSNDAQNQQGEAVVRQRTGPSVEVKAGQTARVVVLFPDADASASGGQQQGQGRVQVVALQGPPKASNGQQPPAGGQQPPESEIVFAKDQAVNGLVVFGGDAASRRGGAQGNSLTFMAEMGGKALKVEQTGGGGQGGRVFVMTAKLDPQQVQEMMKQQDAQQGQQAQTAGAPQGGEMTDEQRQAQQTQQQEQQRKRQQETQKLQDQVHAVILVYLEGEATEPPQGQ